MKRLTLYLFAGDLQGAFGRFDRNEPQLYQTHNEVVRLAKDLVDAGIEVRIAVFVSPDASVAHPCPGVEVVHLGASSYAEQGLLRADVERDGADLIVAHFPNVELLRAAARTKARVFVIAAGSYNRLSLRAKLSRRRVVHQLNRSRFEWVSNHCMPATLHFRDLGVRPSRLVAWDVPHPFEPADHAPKTLRDASPYRVMYAGSITVDKGVGDLIDAVAAARASGLDIRLQLAGGGGDLAIMEESVQRLGLTPFVEFVGTIGNDAVFSAMRSADLVVVPSRREFPEGFPLTLFEAIASRTPIVCSDHPMFRLHMIDGVSACTFPSGDARSCATAIQRVLGDAGLYSTLSNAAVATRESLRGPADWRTMIVRWAVDGPGSEYLRAHTLTSGEAPSSGFTGGTR